MPQSMKQMAVVSSKEGVALTTVDVYELASAIGSQFEKMIDCHGPESVTGLMPMVIRALEHLEILAKHSENEQAEIIDLRYTVDRLQSEKKLKAEERLKFEKELEQIEDMWKSDAKRQRDAILRLEADNQKLSKSLHEKLFDAKIRDEEEKRLQDLSSQVHSLHDIINKQKEQIRSLEKELVSKNTDLDMLQAHVEHLTRANDDHRRRSSVVQRQAQQLVEEKADLQSMLHNKDQEVTRIKNQLKRLSSLCDPEILSTVTAETAAENVQAANRNKGATECSEPQQEVARVDGMIEQFNSECAVVNPGQTVVNEEELDPPVQGPINREPDEKLYPDRYPPKESGIRKFFKFLLSSPSKLEMRSKPRTDVMLRETSTSGGTLTSPNSRHGYCWQ